MINGFSALRSVSIECLSIFSLWVSAKWLNCCANFSHSHALLLSSLGVSITRVTLILIALLTMSFVVKKEENMVLYFLITIIELVKRYVE